MEADAVLATTRRGEELRYVTEHFRDMQGMRTAPVWAALLLLSGLSAYIRLSRWHAVDLAICIFVLFVAVWLPWSNALYKRRYGMVANATPQPKPLSILDPNPTPRWHSSGYLWAMLILLAVFIGTSLFRGLDMYRGALNLWIVLLFTLPRCFYSTPANGFIRFRRALYITGSSIIFTAIAAIPFLHAPHSAKWPLLETISATLLILSLYDHWLLNTLMTGGHREASYD
jgi:hypothetical protein